MNEHDDMQHERDLAFVRAQFAKQQREHPSPGIDASIGTAARARLIPRRRNYWPAAAGLAACISLAVVLAPVLMLESQHRNEKPMATTDLVLKTGRQVAETAAVQRAQQEAEMMREDVAPPAPLLADTKGTKPESLAIETRDEAHLARAPRSSAAPSSAPASSPTPGALERVQVTGSRIRPEDVEVTQALDELDNAGEVAWRTKILALHSEGKNVVANELLAAFRERFGRADNFSFDDLATEARRAGGANDE